MMRALCGGVAVLALVAGTLCSAAPTAPTSLEPSGAVTVEDPGADLELVAAAASPDGADVWLVVSRTSRRPDAGPARLELVHVDADAVRSRSALEQIGGRALVSIHGIAAADSGGVLALAAGAPALVPVVDAEDGLRAGEPKPVRLDGSAELQGVVRLSDGRLLLTAASGGRSVVAAVDPATGTVAWKHAVGGDAPIGLVRAVATEGGGAVLLGRGGDDPENPKLWIATVSADGEVGAETSIVAFDGDAARLADGSFAVVYEKAGPRAFDVFLDRAGPDLAVTAPRPLLQGQLLSGGYRVAALDAGGFVVAGSKDRGLWLACFDDDANRTCESWREPQPPNMEIVSNVELLVRGDVIIVPHTAYVVRGREQWRIVQVLRFAIE